MSPLTHGYQVGTKMDLLTYPQMYNLNNLKHIGRNTYNTKEHDNSKISSGKWYWWSRGFGGYSVLDYLIKIKEHCFVEAVKAISREWNN